MNQTRKRRLWYEQGAELAGLKCEPGDLDRAAARLMVYGVVNALPGATQTTNDINGFSA